LQELSSLRNALLQFPQRRNCQGKRKAPFFFSSVPWATLYCLTMMSYSVATWYSGGEGALWPFTPFYFFPINTCFLAISPTDTKPRLWSLIKTLAGFLHKLKFTFNHHHSNHHTGFRYNFFPSNIINFFFSKAVVPLPLWIQAIQKITIKKLIEKKLHLNRL
jgi:hypothetical protein